MEKEIVALRTKPSNLINFREGSYFIVNNTLTKNEFMDN